MSEIKNEMVSGASEKGALNKREDEKMFTQSQLEEIISERLSRERKQNQSLSAVKALLKGVQDRGLISGSSYAEMAAELVEKLKGNKAQEESLHGTSVNGNDAPVRAGQGDSAGAAAEEKDTQTTCGNDDSEENARIENEEKESFSDILSDIKARYPRQAVEKLFSGDLFERFAKGRRGSTKEIVDDFFGFVESANKLSDEDYASFASTAFSSQSGSASTETTLSKQQMEIAKSAGMSYREYQTLLESIPKRKGRTN